MRRGRRQVIDVVDHLAQPPVVHAVERQSQTRQVDVVVVRPLDGEGIHQFDGATHADVFVLARQLRDLLGVGFARRRMTSVFSTYRIEWKLR